MSDAAPLVVIGLALAAVLVLVMVFALVPRMRRAPVEMPMLGHIAELRRRLIVVGVALLVFMTLVFSFGFRDADVAGVSMHFPHASVHDNLAAQAYRKVVDDVVPEGVDLVLLRPMDALVVQIEVTFFLSVLLTLPIFAYQSLAFLMPALASTERRLIATMVPLVTVFFAGGAAFAYLAVLPFLIEFLYGYSAGLDAIPFLAATELVGFVLLVVVLMGLAFELPVAMMGLSRLGLVTPKTFAKYWRHAAVVIDRKSVV